MWPHLLVYYVYYKTLCEIKYYLHFIIKKTNPLYFDPQNMLIDTTRNAPNTNILVSRRTSFIELSQHHKTTLLLIWPKSVHIHIYLCTILVLAKSTISCWHTCQAKCAWKRFKNLCTDRARFTRLCVCVSCCHIFFSASQYLIGSQTHIIWLKKYARMLCGKATRRKRCWWLRCPPEGIQIYVSLEGCRLGHSTQYTRSTCATRFHILAAAFPIYILHSI